MKNGSKKITNKIVTLQKNRKSQAPWLEEACQGVVEKCGNRRKDIQKTYKNREVFRREIMEVKDLGRRGTKNMERVLPQDERPRMTRE